MSQTEEIALQIWKRPCSWALKAAALNGAANNAFALMHDKEAESDFNTLALIAGQRDIENSQS